MSPIFFILVSGSLMGGLAVSNDHEGKMSSLIAPTKPSLSSTPSVPSSNAEQQRVGGVGSSKNPDPNRKLVLRALQDPHPQGGSEPIENVDLNKMEDWMK
jgi:hypothetical protein